MTAVFDFHAGSGPLLISIPHDGRLLAPCQAGRMSRFGRALPDTDWHVRQLYAFAPDLGASIIAANYSRYVVDLNRPSTDEALYENQVATGVCPIRTFAGQEIYVGTDSLPEEEKQARIENYWKPYHDKIASVLDRIRDRFGYALLWDAHSIPRQVPLLFDGSLPDLNIGTDDGRSCAEHLTAAVADISQASNFSCVVDGRFKGGFITRHHGRPRERIYALQLELTQHNYMDEKNLSYDAGRADKLVDTIKSMLIAYQDAAARDYGRGADA